MESVSDLTNSAPVILTMNTVGPPIATWTYYAEVLRSVDDFGTGTEEPDLVPPAAKELLRFTSVNETLDRAVSRDAEPGVQRLKRGGLLIHTWIAVNVDENALERPDEVILDRSSTSSARSGDEGDARATGCISIGRDDSEGPS
jgi:hypothetical protein